MSISKKRPPAVEDMQLNRIISKIYDDINELINAVNRGDTTKERSVEDGKVGDIRLVKNPDTTYAIEGKTNEGWVTTAMTYKDRD